MTRPQAWFIGECMIELRPTQPLQDGRHMPRAMAQSFSGDVYNTAVYFRRRNAETSLHAIDSQFISAAGDDSISASLRNEIAQQQLGVALMATVPDALPGLYWIETNAAGERSFLYWRQQSAARRMLDEAHAAMLRQQAVQCRLLYFSGITLAILDNARRQRLLDLAQAVRAHGGWVAFDSNYRPRLWESREDALRWTHLALAQASHALVTLDDETALHGDIDAHACLQRMRAAGVDEAVVKLGDQGCLVQAADMDAATAVATQKVAAIDTTAAGDSFNAAYLAARRQGASAIAAAEAGCALAACVVMHPGAIMPLEAMPSR
ncbi:sugar kinase [Herbaspirillum sp. RV1423]|uniref:sugar kinase n=1 Tax=Herbaspirillum sp. RV1423 TaxID=1443993 RepID=UPI0004B65C8E|nr:sugar kinase [Herbaspirillum sp. RV1423]